MADEIQVINPFYDVEQIKERTDNQQLAIDSLRNLKEISIGEGSKVLRVDRNGFWLGAEKFADAPFSVDMLGNAIINSIDLSGYLTAGGSGQNLTGSINVGDSTIVMDGINGRLLFYNSATPSIVLGNPS